MFQVEGYEGIWPVVFSKEDTAKHLKLYKTLNSDRYVRDNFVYKLQPQRVISTSERFSNHEALSKCIQSHCVSTSAHIFDSLRCKEGKLIAVGFRRMIPCKLGSLARPQLRHSSCSWSPSLQRLTEKTRKESTKAELWVEKKGVERGSELDLSVWIRQKTKKRKGKQTYLYVCVTVPSESYIPLSVRSCRWRWSYTPLHIDSISWWKLETHIPILHQC